MLNDTDFDGIDDNKELGDEDKTTGRFRGNAREISRVDYTNDFRYFFIDNDKYNDELAVMSLMIANGKYVNTDQVNASDIYQYIQKIGFTNIWQKDSFRISDTETIRGKLYVGKKTIQYRVYASKDDNVGKNAYKDVYGIFLMDFDNETNMKYLLANFNTDEIEEYYDRISQDIDEYVENYMSSNPSSNDYCFWVTGYSIAGGIASHVSPYLIGKSETYTYTFGAPNTTTCGSTANANIKNIINEDDLIPKVVSREEGYGRVGTLYNDSIYDNLQLEYRKLVGSLNNYEAYVKLANTIKKAISSIKSKETTETLKDRACRLLSKYLTNYEYLHDEVTMSAYPEISIYLNPKVRSVKSGHNIKSYYVLAKSLNGFDLNNIDVGWSDVEEEPDSGQNIDYNRTDLVDIIKEIGEWYVNNVYTYQAGRYGAETADNITGTITYYADEQEYQDKFKDRFRESWRDASDTAKANRRNYMKETKNVPDEKIDLIMQDYNVVEAVANGTFAELSVDILKKNEKYTTFGRLEQLIDGKTPTLFGYYYNELVKNKVQDDCSSFVSAVIYLFVNSNKEIPADKKYTSMPHYTSYSLRTNASVKTELESKGFKCYEGELLTDLITLKPGDILIREGHVEFYLGEDWSFGWRQVHNSYENNPHAKSFKWHFGTEDEVEGNMKPEGYYFYNLNQNNEGHFTRVFRYEEQ